MSWPDEVIDETKDVLKNTPAYAFRGEQGCLLKNLDGRRGYIRFDDALSGKFRIYAVKNELSKDELLTYATIDELIKADWVVD